MAPRILHREHQPEQCPECGSRRLTRVRPEDIEVPGIEDPEEVADPFPGALECAKCGTIVRWQA